MGVLSNLTRRFWNWIRPEIELDTGGGGGGPVHEERPSAPQLRSEEQRRKLDACNQALAAAADARDRLRQAASTLARKRERCQADLQQTVEQGDIERGGEHALRLQEISAEETDVQQRWQDAQAHVDHLSALREQIVRMTNGSNAG